MNSNKFKDIDTTKPINKLVGRTIKNPYMNSKLRTDEEHFEHTELSFRLMDKISTLFHNYGIVTKRCGFPKNKPYQYSIKDIDSFKDNYFNLFAKVNMEDNKSDYTYIKYDKFLSGLLDVILVFKQHKIENKSMKFKNNDFEIVINSYSNEKYEYEFKGFMFIDDILEKFGEIDRDFKIYYKDLNNNIEELFKKINKNQKEKHNKIHNEIEEIITSLCPNYYKNLLQSYHTKETYLSFKGTKKKRIKNIWNFVSNFGNKFQHSYTNSQIDYSVRTIISTKLYLKFKNKNFLPAYITMRDCNLNINDKDFLKKYLDYNVFKLKSLNNEYKYFNEEINKVNNSTFTLKEIKEILENSNCIKTFLKKSYKNKNKKSFNQKYLKF